MSENSIAQTDATQPERWWFTFGSGQTHPLTGEDLNLEYVVLEGTYEETREAMFASPFGHRWSFQYATADKAGVDRFGLRQIEMPEPTVEAESKIWACPENCGYNIADGPTAYGEASTDELISEHMEEHTPVDPWALVEPTPAEPVDEPESERAAYTRGLREIADWYDAHPEVPMPYHTSVQTGKLEATFDIYLNGADQRARLSTIARAMGQFDKVPDGDLFRVVRRFGGIAVTAQAQRDEVCERIVVGTHEVTELVPDPEAVAALPTVAVTKVVEDVRWECRSILADEPARVAAALLTPDSAELPAEVAF